MNAVLNGLGRELFGWFGQLSIELAVLALVVLAASRLLPIKSPSLRHLLWVVVLLKPIVAVMVSSPFTLFTPFTPLVPLAESGRDALAFLPVEPPVHAAAFPVIATSSAGLTAAGWGAILWIAGAALLIGRILIGHGILWRLRRQAQVQHGGPLFDALRQARLGFDCYPRVEVATSSSIGSPIALGILRPLILFPADLVDKLRADELSLILMHEMAHVRRCDNLVLLLHRLVAAAFFFHPAVWLCGRMLRREAEQACDDLVVFATGREKAYARGLAQVAERGARLNPLVRRIPTMNAFAAAESDLALRVRRTLGGGARPMGTPARLLAAVLLGPLMAVTLPSCGSEDTSPGDNPAMAEAATESGQEEGAWREALATDSTIAELKTRLHVHEPDSTIAELKARLHAHADSPIAELKARLRAHEPKNTIAELKARLRAHEPDSTIAELKARLRAHEPDSTIAELKARLRAHEPDSTIAELKARLRAHEPDSTIEELKARLRAHEPDNTIEELKARLRALESDSTFVEVRQGRLRGEAMAMATYHLAQGPPLALKWDTTIEEIAEAVRKRQEGGFPASAEALIRTAVVVERAMATPLEEWTEDLKADVERAGWDLDQFSREIRSRRVWQEAMATDPEEWSEELKARILSLKAPEKASLFIVLNQDGSMKLSDESVTFATLKEELKASRQLHDDTATIVIVIQGDERAMHGQIVQVMEIARQVGLVDQVIATEPQTETSAEARKGEDNRNIQELKTGERIWAQAVLTDPKDWSEELEAQLLALNPGSTIEEIAEEITRRILLRKLRTIAEANPGTWWDQIKDQLPDSTVTSEEIEEIRRRLQKGALAEGEKGGHR